MACEFNMQDKTDWKKHWEDEHTPWDLKGPHPATRYMTAEAKKILTYDYKDKHVIIPGSGRAHDAKVFLEKSSKVTAVDLSEIACEEARKLYGKFPGFEAKSGDFFKMSESMDADIVFDRAMLCALPSELRKVYVSSVAKVLKKGGLVFTVPFREFEQEIDGPPFTISETEMNELFGNDFELVMTERSKFESGLGLIKNEHLYVYSRK